MRPYEELVKEGLIQEGNPKSAKYIADIYKDQLIKFDKIGLGKETENGVRITKELIEVTKKRLYQLYPLAKLRERQ